MRGCISFQRGQLLRSGNSPQLDHAAVCVEQHPAALVRVKAAALHDAGGVMGCGVVPGGGQGLTHEGGFSNGFPVDGVQGINKHGGSPLCWRGVCLGGYDLREFSRRGLGAGDDRGVICAGVWLRAVT